MAAKEGLDKANAAEIEKKAEKELAEKAKDAQQEESPEVARNPELPPPEHMDAKDLADTLAPTESHEEEEKVAEEAAPVEEEGGKEEVAAEKQEEEAVQEEGVKVVADPAEKAENAHEEPKVEEVLPEEAEDKLVVEGAHADKAEKREMGDVFFVASLAALAHADPAVLEKNCKENSDRTYTVTLYEKDPKADGGYQAHEIIVSPQGPSTEGEGVEGKGQQDTKTDFILGMITQAYTEWKGGADKVGEGKGGAAMEALTGKPTDYLHTQGSDADALWASMIEACNWNRPILATTRASENKALWADAEVKPWHAYVVLKCKEVNGKRMVTLRNPYARAGAQEGNTLEFDLDKFAKLYRGVSISQHLPDKEAPPVKDENLDKGDDPQA